MPEEMTVAARYIKADVDDLIGTWGMASIIEVIRFRVEAEMKKTEGEDFTRLQACAKALKIAEMAVD